MKRGMLVLVAVLALAACGGDDGDGNVTVEEMFEGTPPCGEIVGETLTADEWDAGCLDGDTVELSGSIECDDGRTIHWNRGGWAYEGEPAQATDDGAVPADVYWTECQGITR